MPRLLFLLLLAAFHVFHHPSMYILVFDKPRGSVNTQFTGRTISIGDTAHFVPPAYHYGELKAMKTRSHIVVTLTRRESHAIVV